MTTRGQVAAAALLSWALLSGGCGDPSPSPGTQTPAGRPCLAVGADLDPHTSGDHAQFCDSDGDCDDLDVGTFPTSGAVVDASGVPAANLWLRFWRRDFSANTKSGADGAFAARLRAGGDYDVDAFLGATSEWELGKGRRVHVGTVSPGTEQVTLRLPEAQVVLASGVLVDRVGTALTGWSVQVSRLDEAGHDAYVPPVTTDADGRYRVLSWRGGRVRFAGTYGPEGENWRIARSSTDTATGETRNEARPAIVGNVVVDDGGSPAGATVRLWRNSGILDRCVAVDASGAFDFDDTYPGADYEIGVELSGYETIERLAIPYDALDVRLELVGLGQRIEGRLVDSLGEPVACTWIQFVAAGARRPVQAMTGVDGAFRTVQAWDTEYEAFVLVPAGDGHLVTGPKVGGCRGGQMSLVLRTPR